jgi:[protein-PII] uridylyltransferase
MITVETQIDFDETSSAHSTLLEVIAQDVAGLLRAVSLTLAEHGCNIEVALVDTEGETAIDVFYLTKDGAKLTTEVEAALRSSLLEAIEGNVG